MQIPLPLISHFHFLVTEKARYKVLYGGRGSGKSWQIARALLGKAHTEANIKILCTRQIQNTIADSVYEVIEGQAKELKLHQYFDWQKNYIKHLKTGSLFLFKGLYKNVTEIKSTEGIKYCWIAEAQDLLEDSFDIIDPTIRMPDSEILIDFNPCRDDDFVYDFFVNRKQKDAIVKKVNYTENPHFPDVLETLRQKCESQYPSKYKHIWLGEPITNYDTLVYRWNAEKNLILNKNIPYTRGMETCVTFDFGVSDDTAIIFFHVVKIAPTKENPRGVLIQIFDEYTNNNKPAEHYREIIDAKGYLIDRFFCDPSGKNRDSDLSSWVDKLSYNHKTGRRDWHFEYTHTYSMAEMIDHANDLLPYVIYNPKDVPGVHKMFRHWMYRTDKDGKIILPPKPEHDEYSHYGTAWYYAMVNRFPVEKNIQKAVLK